MITKSSIWLFIILIAQKWRALLWEFTKASAITIPKANLVSTEKLGNSLRKNTPFSKQVFSTVLPCDSNSWVKSGKTYFNDGLLGCVEIW